MNKNEIAVSFKNHLVELYKQNKDLLWDVSTELIQQKREKAVEIFHLLGFPSTKLENWKKTDLSTILGKEYNTFFEKPSTSTNINDVFKCDVNNFDTDVYAQLNGWFIEQKNPITVMNDGTIVGSLAAAMKQYPELINKHFGNYADDNESGIIALNTALFTDGLFVYVPKNVEASRTIQLVNIISLKENIFANTRNLIILEANSKLQLIHCDDSMDFKNSFINTITEVILGEGSSLDYYKLQNKDSESAVLTSTFIHQKKDSNLSTNTITLNGGVIRNDIHVNLSESGATSDISGIYLVDKKQFVDNHVKVIHNAPHCTSTQLYKGIADDSARAVFNGHILVQRDAQQTAAFQNNNNIQLTDTAKIDTHPFLEIYADDVKCSHGATVGQLDMDAMFYLMQRGICHRNARMLLMVAFAGEVVNKIKIEVLKTRIDDLVRRRLKGELSACEQCAVHCANPDAPLHFEIDLSKI